MMAEIAMGDETDNPPCTAPLLADLSGGELAEHVISAISYGQSVMARRLVLIVLVGSQVHIHGLQCADLHRIRIKL